MKKIKNNEDGSVTPDANKKVVKMKRLIFRKKLMTQSYASDEEIAMMQCDRKWQ